MKDVKRKLYEGSDGDDARYEVLGDPHVPGRAHFRIWDATGDNALVFLTPAQVRRLIADLRPHAVTPRKAVRR
jgi:hypothetical protein